jgi:hypothetical protein
MNEILPLSTGRVDEHLASVGSLLDKDTKTPDPFDHTHNSRCAVAEDKFLTE